VTRVDGMDLAAESSKLRDHSENALFQTVRWVTAALVARIALIAG